MVPRELWYCHVAVLSFHASSSSNPPRFPCAYPFLTRFSRAVLEVFRNSKWVMQHIVGKLSTYTFQRYKFCANRSSYERIMAPGNRGVGVVFACFSGEDSGQTGDAIGEPRVPRRSLSHYLSNAPGLADQLVASRKDSAREGGCPGGKTRFTPSAFFLKSCPSSQAAGVFLVRWRTFFRSGFRLDPVNSWRSESSLSCMNVSSFQRTLGSRINLLRVRKTLRASVATSVGKFWKFQHNLISSACFHARGRRSSLMSDFDDLGIVGKLALPTFQRVESKLSSRSSEWSRSGQFDSAFGLVNGPVKSWSNLVNLGSNLVEFGQSPPNSGKCIPDRVSRVFGHSGPQSVSSGQAGSARAVSFCAPTPEKIPWDSPSIAKSSQASICQIEMGPSWMDPILDYLSKDILPANQKEAAKIRKTATRYWVSRKGKLYKKSYTGPYLLCVHPDLIPNLLYEIHEGVCGGHTGRRSLAHRAIGQGYWWPYIQKDAAQYVRRYLVGPLPRATGNRQWLIVATDYFTKWVEAEPLARITDSESRKFIWKNKITRFGIPKCLISDNGTQFDSGPFKKYCSEFGIRNHFTSPAYPQGNGQAESSNKTILNGIKKRLEEVKGRWVEELPTILWTFRTTPRSSTGETPFSLTYGVEAVIPLEVGLPTLRSEEYDQENNELMLAKDLDLAQERRDLAMIRLASYQGDLKKRYGKSVSERILAPGDLVLRKVLGSRKDPTQGKLGANWEGPYQIISEAGLGAFNLKGMDDKPLKRPWNISNLKKFFQCSACESSSGVVERHQNPSHARCFACKPSSGVAKRHQNPGHVQSGIKTLAMLGVSFVNPQVVWRNGIKTLATLGVLKSPVYEPFIMRQSNIDP
uniref:Integrase catalytic domain-containing protein n=1 Tax=Fagus sylvatica TaxID=28930 RepID=A0A2N9HQC1_FAGSY